MNPSIVISSYNRPGSLKRLLGSLAAAKYSGEINLVISIDGPGDKDVIACANEFIWNYGDKKIIIHENHLGLKRHILACTDLVETLETIILLEDDIFVSPYFYEYAQQVTEFYVNDERLAGISLYNYTISEFSDKPFLPLDDGYDNYFLQLPSSWGQIFTKKQWSKFKQWYSKNEDNFNDAYLPEPVSHWGEHSWKKHFIQYMIDMDLFFLYPKQSLTTNFEDIGTNSDSSGKFQVPLSQCSRNYNFSTFDDSNLKYDAWYEILPEAMNNLTPIFKNYDFEMDLAGSKTKLEKPYIVTNKVADTFEISFGNFMKPNIQNIIHQVPGNSFRLAKRENIRAFINPELMKETFFIVVPITKLDKYLLKKTLESLSSNLYLHHNVILAVSNKCKDDFSEYINMEFGQKKDNWSIHYYPTQDLGMCLKLAYDAIARGIITWLSPGNELSTNDLVIANKVFTEVKQAGAVVPAGNKLCSNEYRLNTDVIIQSLLNNEIRFSTELLFFKSEFWPSISKMIGDKSLENDYFFSWFLFALIQQTDLYPCLSDLGLNRALKQHTYPKPDKNILLLEVQNIGKSINKKVKMGLVFRILKSISRSNIPVFCDLYYLYYDLPLVIYCKEMDKGAYLFKK